MDAAGVLLHDVRQTQREREGCEECLAARECIRGAGEAGVAVEDFEIEAGAFAFVVAVDLSREAIAAAAHDVEAGVRRLRHVVQEGAQHETLEVDARFFAAVDVIEALRQLKFRLGFFLFGREGGDGFFRVDEEGEARGGLRLGFRRVVSRFVSSGAFLFFGGHVRRGASGDESFFRLFSFGRRRPGRVEIGEFFLECRFLRETCEVARKFVDALETFFAGAVFQNFSVFRVLRAEGRDVFFRRFRFRADGRRFLLRFLFFSRYFFALRLVAGDVRRERGDGLRQRLAVAIRFGELLFERRERRVSLGRFLLRRRKIFFRVCQAFRRRLCRRLFFIPRRFGRRDFRALRDYLVRVRRRRVGE